MNRYLKFGGIGLGGLLAIIVVGGGGFYVWAGMKVDSTFAKTWEAHEVDFPIPFPLSEAELDELRAEKMAEQQGEGAEGEEAPAEVAEGEEAEKPDPLEGVDLDALALERAQARGKHYVESIYVCTECHGQDFTGGTMLDDGAIGKVTGPNLTALSKDYTPTDWDHAVRHGVLPGTNLTSIMPVGDFKRLSDRELSDIAAYIRSLPAKETEPRVREWGPMGRVLIATGTLVPDVYKVDHGMAHPETHPEIAPTAEYGQHITTVCTGCHREEFNGGPMPFGPPDWPPAGNLTQLQDWSYDEFVAAIKQGKRKNGETMRPPMSLMIKYANNMTDTELTAMFTYLQTLEPLPTGE